MWQILAFWSEAPGQCPGGSLRPWYRHGCNCAIVSLSQSQCHSRAGFQIRKIDILQWKITAYFYSRTKQLYIFVLNPGIGIASAVIVFFTICYYAVILAWALFYLFQSFRAELPWQSCNHTWNTNTCMDNFTYVKSLNLTPEEISKNFTSPVVEYWE